MKLPLMHPSEDLRILREMLVPEMILEPFIGTDGKAWLRLTDPDNPRSCVTITDLLPHTLAFKSDAFTVPGRCFQSSRGEAKRADYILISAGEKERWVIFIEIKGSPRFAYNAAIYNQLRGSRCFFEYVRIIGRSFWESPEFLKEYHERYVVFPRATHRGKPANRFPGSLTHNTPEQVRRIMENMGIRFRKLV